MNKTINLKSVLRKKFLYTGIMSAALFVSLFFGVNNAFAMITNSLDLGSTGEDVTELQTYLANNSVMYPSGLVTGYFGQLTKAAVERFQTAQGIVSQGTPETTGYGRVGPITMARINSLLNSPVPQAYWDASPSLSATSIQYGSTLVTLSWTTNEASRGQVYYSNVPLLLNEATGPRQQPYVSGSSSVGNGGMTSHSITIQNLEPNTTYYYLTRAVDNVGNMSMTWPSTFRTNQ